MYEFVKKWHNGDTKDLSKISVRYYSYVILNGEYKIIVYGKRIYDNIIKQYEYDINNKSDMRRPRIYKVKIGMQGPYKDFSESYYTDKYLDYDLTGDLVKTKTMYIEDFLSKNSWKNDIKSLSLFFEECGMEDIHKKFRQEIRQKKLERIIN